MASPSTLQPTRQQIDELDALLKHMLTLPEGPAELKPEVAARPPDAEAERIANSERLPPDEPAAFGTSYRVSTGESPFTPKDTPRSKPARAEAPPAEPPKPQARVDAVPLPVYPPHGDPDRGSRIEDRRSKIDNYQPRSSILDPQSSILPPAASVPPSLWLRILRGINGRFDQWTGRLGAWGSWLGRPAGRKLLGGVGIVALAAAAALLLRDWFDWPR